MDLPISCEAVLHCGSSIFEKFIFRDSYISLVRELTWRFRRGRAFLLGSTLDAAAVIDCCRLMSESDCFGQFRSYEIFAYSFFKSDFDVVIFFQLTEVSDWVGLANCNA